MLGRHIEFIKERQYVMNVSPATIRWYTSALKWLDSEEPTQEELTRLVVRMRERGLKATGRNAATRAINAYLHWASGATGKCGGGCRRLINLLPNVRVTNQSEYHFWNLPALSAMPVLVTADFVWSEGETHFSQHRSRITSYVYNEPAEARSHRLL